MKNELKEICNKLEGYTTSGIPDFEVLEAKKNQDGTWSLLIQKSKEEWVVMKQEKENADE